MDLLPNRRARALRDPARAAPSGCAASLGHRSVDASRQSAWCDQGELAPTLSSRTSQRPRRVGQLHKHRVRTGVESLPGKTAGRSFWNGTDWFQRMAVRHLSRSNFHHNTSNSQITLFAYSYAARELFRFAKGRGWRTVLGQIDPGLHEEKLVRKLFDESSGDLGDWRPAPSDYWQNWREECELADCIVVNSEWSRQGLLAENVPAKKLHVTAGIRGNNGHDMRIIFPRISGTLHCRAAFARTVSRSNQPPQRCSPAAGGRLEPQGETNRILVCRSDTAFKFPIASVHMQKCVGSVPCRGRLRPSFTATPTSFCSPHFPTVSVSRNWKHNVGSCR